ncbi:MAG: hypothetical protein A2204_04735 [Elusimicrobia bacterium RIFOXYA1_FULL_47_7]|nr:MAG: hypothetical protein A2278_00305 [Elusimicrobia bacterium RIFOXYA12_FULL_49_49]OGS09812.1 MAG: hypothetical protein A2204_04735 [Elusimicrobia bacterium RIFOXYA1_FULL_47_7]OGS15103.1 MAG: hypothetical protein A2251_00315 [Elusimicrobia bacterium RIFOXYA2_FULL_47_53]OGS29723.1 MAG: hypothetical protein A2323_01115 [Elusimicrobia bacterium RIFOXYB2_FULL_46_23]
MNLKIIPALLAFVFIASGAHAVTTGVDFLKLGIGARETGMGEASVASHSGVDSSYWNPAGLSDITQTELSLMHSDAIIDASLNFVGVAVPLKNGDVICVNTIVYVIKPVPVTDASGQSMGDLNWLDGAAAVSYARNITDSISAGLSAKIVHRMESDPIFGRSEGSAYAFDAGAIYKTHYKGLSVGYALLNTGTELQMTGEVKKDTLPQTSRLGLTYEYELDKNLHLVGSWDFHRILDNSWHTGAGVEINIRNEFFLRTGFYEKDGSISGNTFGFGFMVNQFRFDYSSIPVSEMTGYNRNNKFSLSVFF